MFYNIEDHCRSCAASGIQQVLGFGITPLADYLLTPGRLEEKDLLAPLTLAFCSECSLVQIVETVSPQVSFGEDYLYFSSVSKGLLQHFRDSALNIVESRKLDSNSLVVEAASNDGYLLKNFKEQGIPVLGIDPAPGPATAAERSGINTLRKFFSLELAHQLRSESPQGADVFLANNVLAHVPDLNGFVEGIRVLLKPTGVVVIEVPYLVDLLEKCEFDTIYHQHFCYFSVTALDKLFRRHGLFLNDIERTRIHGGSLRLFIEPVESVKGTVKNLLEKEDHAGVKQLDYYRGFATRVDEIKTELLKMLRSLKQHGKRIVGYGAAAKATTLLSYIGIDSTLIDYIVDKNEIKHGRYMGGSHLLILPVSKLVEDLPDYVLILAWNFADEIIRDQSEYVKRGGRFIIPIPDPKII